MKKLFMYIIEPNLSRLLVGFIISFIIALCKLARAILDQYTGTGKNLEDSSLKYDWSLNRVPHR
jgi:hypothetical protein